MEPRRLDPAGALREIESGRVEPIYLIYGPDIGAVRRVIEALRTAVLGPEGERGLAAFNHERFEGREVRTPGAVLDSCAQLPMGAPRRLVEVAGPEEFVARGESTADLVTALLGYFSAPNPSSVLVVTSTGIDGRAKLVKQAPLSIQALEGSDESAITAVMAHAKANGFSVKAAAIRSLVAAIGPAQSELIAALERAHAFAGGEEIDVDHVIAVSTQLREANVFDLTDAIGHGDGPKALAVLAQLFSGGERDVGSAMRLTGLLAWQLRNLYTVKVARDPVAAGIKPFVADKLRGQVRSWSRERLSRAYAALARLDDDLKGGSLIAYHSPYLAVQRFVLEVCEALPGVAHRV